MLSQRLTWCSPAGPWRRSSASGCRSVQQSGTVSTCVTSTRLPGGAPRVRLARLAGPLRPRQGHRDPYLAPSGRCAPAPGQDPAAVLGRPGGHGRAGRLLPRGQLGQLHLIISPRTLLRWRAHLVRRYWTCPRRAPGRPRAAKPVRVLVLEMARDNPAGDTAAFTVSWPGSGTSWPRRRCGRSSKTRASTPRPDDPGRPGGHSLKPGRRRSWRRASSTSIPYSCGACTCCSSSSTAPAACTWPGSPHIPRRSGWSSRPGTC